MYFGGITVLCGLLGTICGSLLLDWILKKYDADHPNIDDIRTLEGSKLLFFAILFSTLFALVATLSTDFTVFLSLLAVSEFLIFL